MKLVLVGSALLALLVAGDPAENKPHPNDFGPGTIDVSSYPAEQQKAYAVYSVKCQKCHPLARSVNARFNAAEWKRYIKRMIRRPNSGINEEQAVLIYGFLTYYSAQLGL